MIYNPAKKGDLFLALICVKMPSVEKCDSDGSFSFNIVKLGSFIVISHARPTAYVQSEIALQSHCVAHQEPTVLFVCTYGPVELLGIGVGISISAGVGGEPEDRPSCTRAGGVRSGTSQGRNVWPVLTPAYGRWWMTLTYGVPAAPASRPLVPFLT